MKDDPFDKLIDAWIEPVLRLAEKTLAGYYGVDVATVQAYMGGGFGGYWYCKGCGNPQLGDPPWKWLLVEDRCKPCGPGAGFVRCPATHGAGRCGLCRGEGWLAELDPAA